MDDFLTAALRAAVAFALAAQGAGIALIPRTLIDAVATGKENLASDWRGLPLPYGFVAILPKRSIQLHETHNQETYMQVLLGNLMQVN